MDPDLDCDGNKVGQQSTHDILFKVLTVNESVSCAFLTVPDTGSSLQLLKKDHPSHEKHGLD